MPGGRLNRASLAEASGPLLNFSIFPALIMLGVDCKQRFESDELGPPTGPSHVPPYGSVI